MKTLFYVDPIISSGDPLFHLGAAKGKLAALAKIIAGIGHEVTFCLPSTFVPFFGDVDGADIKIIDSGEFARHVGISAELDYELYRNPDGDVADKAASFYRNSVTFDPDLVILWEGVSRHLKQAFPGAKFLHLMPGFLGRLPYPDLVSFDRGGLFKHSSLYHSLDEVLAATPVTEQHWQVAEEIRARSESFFDGMRGAQSLVSSLSSQHEIDSLALLPLQFSKHYSFRVDTPYSSQAQMLLDAVQRFPASQGILVTQYVTKAISEQVMTPEMLYFLNERHPNVLFDRSFDRIDNISQFLLPFADKVITCSSSLGLQSVLYNKPAESLHDTFLAPMLKAGQDPDARRKLLGHLLFGSTVQWERLLDPAFLSAFLEMQVAASAAPEKAPPLLTEIDPDYGQRLVNSLRFERAEQKVGSALKGARMTNDLPDKVVEMIRSAEVVSFDVFETLVERPLAQPLDVFKIVEARIPAILGRSDFAFPKARVEAEHVAKDLLPEDVEEVNLDQIYEQMGVLFDIDEPALSAVKDMELRVERELMTSRPIGKKIFRLCESLGKKIIFASDMYLPKSVIEQLLTDNGYKVDGNLYLSSEIGLKKKTGSMFTHILAELDLKPQQLLHFGDNATGDQRVPEGMGIRAIRLARAIDKMRNHKKFGSLFSFGNDPRPLAESAQIYLTARRLFDNPFRQPLDDCHFNASAQELGYVGLGPCITDFATWLGRRVESNENDAVFFIARDGRIMKEVYEILHPEAAARSCYAYGSRRMLRNCFEPSFHEFRQALGNLNEVIPAHAVENTYGYTPNDEVLQRTVSTPAELATAVGALRHVLSELGKRNVGQRDLLMKYADDIGYLDAASPAIVEIGYAGTIQEGYFRATGKGSTGYYFTLFDTAGPRVGPDMPMEGYTGHLVERTRHWHSICSNGFMYETLFCSDEATITGLRQEGDRVRAVREPSEHDIERRELIRQIHHGARVYAKDLAALLAPVMDLMIPDPELGARVLADYIRSPSGRDASLFEGVIFSNNFREGSYRYVVPPRAAIAGKKADVHRAVWKEGTAAFSRRGDLFPKPARKPSGTAPTQKPQRDAEASRERNPPGESDIGNSIRVDSAVSRSPLIRIERTAVKFLTRSGSRKRRKYEASPYLFFADSKSSFARLYGAMRFRGMAGGSA